MLISFGIVTPGTIGVSSSGRVAPCGIPMASGVSWLSGAASRSVRVPRWVFAISETYPASVWKIS